MGNTVKRGFQDFGDTMKKGLGAWVDPHERKGIMRQVGHSLEGDNLRTKLAAHAEEAMGPVGGLVAKATTGLMDAMPVGRLAKETAQNAAKGDYAAVGKGLLGAAKDPGGLMSANAKDIAKGVLNSVRK